METVLTWVHTWGPVLARSLTNRVTLSKSLVSLALISLTYRGELRSVPEQACSSHLGQENFYRTVPHTAECLAFLVPSHHASSTSESSEGPETSPHTLSSFWGGYCPLECHELPFVAMPLL